ncbi:SURF1 family protein [Maricaulis sp.]|uniref:SURF1 family protein n=1 Tax=Maricaulis sp. TaxID=1486257 RepID=UPI00262B51F0|nr:SURF1 family protein [Maricaulis sp.]
MLRFRPFPLLTLFSLPALALLVILGFWQVQRMTWKAERIAAFEARGQLADFRTAICTDFDGAFGPSVSGPAPLAGETLRLYALRDQAGWVRVGLMPVPACDPSGEPGYVFVETAFESLAGGGRATPRQWRIEPFPAAGRFAGRNDTDTNQWYRFDAVAMARALGVDPDRVHPVWARADTGLPASLAQTPPARHFGYALTWFGLALALVGVYLALHIARGRLGPGRPGGAKD